MTSFEKFKNKQITEERAAQVMGGGYEDCQNADPLTPTGSCVRDYYNTIVLQSCYPELDDSCLDYACGVATFACIPW